MARESNSPFICLTETHLTPDVLDAEISIEGYNLFRSDRLNRSHGGVCTYVRKDLAVASEIKDSNSYCDVQILHIPQLNLIITNVYRPPNCPESMFVQTLQKVSSSLRSIESQKAHDYLILGDFNFPFLNFKGSDIFDINENVLKNTCKHCIEIEHCSHTTSERRQAQNLLNLASEFFLQQHISKPTRKHNILDLVFTNNHYLINNYHMIVNNHLSDHYTICLSLNYENVKVEKISRKINHYHSQLPEYNFRDADEEDWMRLNMEIDLIDWSTILADKSPDEMTKIFLEILLEKVWLVFKKLSTFESTEKKDFSSNNKIPRQIRILMRNKRKLSESIQRTKSMRRCLNLRDKLESIEKELKESYDKRRINQEKEALKKIKKDPGAFYKYAKKFSKSTSDIRCSYRRNHNNRNAQKPI